MAQIGNVHMGQLGNDEEIGDVFDEFQDRLGSDIGLSTAAREWNPAVRQFRQNLPAVLAALTAEVTAPAATPPASPSSSAASGPPAKITVKNFVVVPSGFGTEVQGEATNNDRVEHGAFLKATFYDENDRIVGTADGAVSQLASGETKTFSLLSENTVPKYARLKVQIDTVF